MPYPYEDNTDTPLTNEQVMDLAEQDPVKKIGSLDGMSAGTPKPKPSKPAAKPAQQATQPAAKPKPKPKEQPSQDASSYIMDNTAQGGLLNLGQGLTSIAAGVVDFGVDLLNMIPKPNIENAIANPFYGKQKEIPKPPDMPSKTWQSIREVSSVVVPAIYLGKAGLGAGAAAQKAVGWKLGTDAAFKWFARAGVSAGTGAAVDAISKTNESNDNLSGYLKKTWPKTFGWISDDWATVAGDSPDVYKAKNVKEGVGFNWLVDIGEAAARLIGAAYKTKAAAKIWRPRDDTAKNFFAQLEKIKPGGNPLENVEIDIDNAIKELGQYREAKKGGVFTEPTFGIHSDDFFDDVELGIRRVDPEGVIGAVSDVARIQENIGTRYGRPRNFISEPAMKYGLGAETATARVIVRGIEQQLNDAGKFDVLIGAKEISHEKMMESVDELAARWYNSRMTVEEMKRELAPFQTETSGEFGKPITYLGERATNAVTKVMKELLRDYSESSLRAAGLASTQKAGQLADTAEAARLMEGTPAIERTQEQILDMMEFLMVERGISSYMRGRGLANLNIWRKAKNLAEGKSTEKWVLEQKQQKLAELLGNTKNSVNQLREISKERPEFLVPLQMAWEFTDGNVDTLDKLHKFIENSLSDLSKAFVDGDPEVPNLIVQGAWGNIYNATLSALGTPAKAFWSNTAQLLLKPITIMAGAALRGDKETMKRAWFMYSSMGTTLQRGYEHMGLVFRKASADPKSVEYIIRDDIAIKNEQAFDIANSYAMAAEKLGEDGPAVLYEYAKNLHDLEMHPALRFGSNALTATDGLSRAMIANSEARLRVYERFITGGEELNGKTLREAEEDIYREMFDENGMITEKAIDYASREIQLNLDTKISSAVSQMIRELPIIRPFMMFSRTSTNLIRLGDTFGPVSAFVREYNDLAYKSADSFTPDEIREILTRKGIPFDAYAKPRFDMLRAEILGRKAVAGVTLTGASVMFMNDRLTGDGFYDKERQRTRESLNWKRRSYKGWDGKWYSYDGLGVLSDWIAGVATIMDHFDTLDPMTVQTLLSKSLFLLGTTLTSKTMLAGIEPIFDIFRGNPDALNKWAASFSNNMLPLGSLRAEMGRIMYGPLRELDSEFGQLVRNRNNWLDAVDPKGALPIKTSWINGKPITGGENFWARAYNAVMPFKSNGEIDKYGQFLMDIEYDGRPTMMKSSRGGVEYNPKERAEIFSLVGNDPFFRKELDRIMSQVDGRTFRDQVRKARENGEVDYEQFNSIHAQVDTALREAKKMAEAKMSNQAEIEQRMYEQNLRKISNKTGTVSPLTMTNI